MVMNRGTFPVDVLDVDDVDAADEDGGLDDEEVWDEVLDWPGAVAVGLWVVR